MKTLRGQYEFDRREVKNHYFLILYYNRSTYYYVFKDRVTGKELRLQVSFQQYHEQDTTCVAGGGRKQYLVDQLKFERRA